MLVELRIRGLGVISDASLRLGPGLNVVTGETGAGKTLLVTSVGLLMGGRGQARLVASGADEAVIEAVVVPPPALEPRLRELGLDAEDGELIWTRRLGSDGRSRAWIGGRLVPAATLASLGETIIEVHGQGAGFALANAGVQLDALDALARNHEVVERYRETLKRLRALERERDEIVTDERTRVREAEFLAFQVDEISRAHLDAGEEDQLAIDLARLEHSERLRAIGGEVLGAVGPDGASAELAVAHKSLEQAVAFDHSCTDLAARLATLAAECIDVSHDIRAWLETLDTDPGRLQALQERKALIGALKRKYGATIAEIIETGAQARARLEQLEHADERVEQLDAEVAAVRADTQRLAADLSRRRRRAAKDLTKLVGAELPPLALPHAVFEAVCTPGEQLTDTGTDRVEFRFSAVRSREPDLIGKVASGGELSRAMIAVTLALARAHAVPVLVFDEADQGVGGEAALELARRLSRLAASHQVLVVTHLPQIAAFADRHISVRRTGDAVEVEILEDSERVPEISRMLAGLERSDLARAHADELIELARRERTVESATVAG